MNRTIGMTATAAGLLAAGAFAATLIGPGIADGASTAKAASKPATFAMYANVDAEGDLGSHYRAVSASYTPGTAAYFVTFNKPIDKCAATVQIGKAGGSDPSTFASVTVDANTKYQFGIQFGTMPNAGETDIKQEPFMLTVTCKS